jgi:hypothetical protein
MLILGPNMYPNPQNSINIEKRRGMEEKKTTFIWTQKTWSQIPRNDFFIFFLNKVMPFAKINGWRITPIEGFKLWCMDLSQDYRLNTKD